MNCKMGALSTTLPLHRRNKCSNDEEVKIVQGVTKSTQSK
jgi:hypothetical protein